MSYGIGGGDGNSAAGAGGDGNISAGGKSAGDANSAGGRSGGGGGGGGVGLGGNPNPKHGVLGVEEQESVARRRKCLCGARMCCGWLPFEPLSGD